MSLSRKRISITTATDGSFSTEVHMQGALRAVALDLGDGGTALSTPDISITDLFDDSVMLADAGVASNQKWYPAVAGNDAADGDAQAAYFVAPVAVSRIGVEVSGGGDTKSGTLYLFVER